MTTKAPQRTSTSKGQIKSNPQASSRGNAAIGKELEKLVMEILPHRVRKFQTNARLREDLGIDSFTANEILVAIENRYNVVITEQEANRLITFNDLVGFVTTKLRKREQRSR